MLLHTRNDISTLSIEADFVTVMRQSTAHPVYPVIYGRGFTLDPINDAAGVPFGKVVHRGQRINPLMFGARADGISLRGTITAGSNLFNSGVGNFQPGDVGKSYKIARANSGHHLIGYIDAVLSPTQIRLDRVAPSTVSNARCVYGTDDYAPIVLARDYCWSNNLSTLEFSGGRYLTTQTMDFARSRFATVMNEHNVNFEFMGTSGPCVRLNGHNISPQYGVYDTIFGGALQPTIYGTSYSAAALHIAGLQRANVRALLRDANIGALINRDGVTGTQSEGAVGSDFFFGVEEQDIGPFDTVPSVGVYCSYLYASRVHLNINKCSKGGYISNSNRNTFYGIAESNADGAIEETSSCFGNVFMPIHAEANGTGPHFNMNGLFRTMIGCAGAGGSVLGANANQFGGQYNAMIGGAFQGAHIMPGAYKTDFVAVEFIGAPSNFLNEGSMTRINSCAGI